MRYPQVPGLSPGVQATVAPGVEEKSTWLGWRVPDELDSRAEVERTGAALVPSFIDCFRLLLPSFSLSLNQPINQPLSVYVPTSLFLAAFLRFS